MDWGGYDWLLHTDQWSLYRSDRVREFFTATAAWAGGLDITINHGQNGVGSGEYSDWGVASVLIYNCTLNASQIAQVRGHQCQCLPASQLVEVLQTAMSIAPATDALV
jgi:hypothetical protein